MLFSSLRSDAPGFTGVQGYSTRKVCRWSAGYIGAVAADASFRCFGLRGSSWAFSRCIVVAGYSAAVISLYAHCSLGGCRLFDSQRHQAAVGCCCAGCSATVPCCMAHGVMGSCRLFDSQRLRAAVGYCRCRLLCRCALMHGPQILCGVARWVCRLLDSQMVQAALVQYLQAPAQLLRAAL